MIANFNSDKSMDLNFDQELVEDEGLDVNPLYQKEMSTQPFEIEPEQDDQEPVQVAGISRGLTQALKRKAKEGAIPSVEVAEDMAGRTQEFIDKNNLDVEMPDKAVNINLKNLDDPMKVNQVINTVAEMMPDQVQKARRGVQSWDQTKLLADELGLTVDELLERPTGQAWNAESITAARWVLADTRDKVGSLAQKIDDGLASEEEMVDFRQLMAKYAGIQMQLHGIAAEAGRALNAFKIVAQSGELRKSEVENLMARSGGDIKKLAKGFNSLKDNPLGQAKFAREMARPGAMKMFLEYWINALLSSPATHAVNVTSNAVVALAQVPETILASGFGKIFSKGEGVQAGEPMARIYGLYAGMKDGWKAARVAFKSGEPSDGAEKIEMSEHNAIRGKNVEQVLKNNVESLNYLLPGKGINPDAVNLSDPVQAGIDAMGTFFRIPSRFLLSEDEFFKGINYRMELNAQAYRAGKAEGLKGDELGEFMVKYIETPPESVNIEAMESAKYHTFTKELGEPGRKFQGAMNDMPITRLIIPFFRTPVNILKYTSQRMLPPLPYIPTKMKDDLLSGDPARRDMAMGRMAMGAMVWGTVIPMVAEKYDCQNQDVCITGGGPSDPKLAANLRRTGWQPYSVKIDDKWYSYSRSDPFGQMLGIASDAATIMANADEQELEEFSASMVMAITNNVVNKTYMSGVSDFVEIFTSNDKEKWLKWANKMGGSVVPAVVAAAERSVDPEARKAEDIVEKWKSRIPGLSSELPPYRDLWGRPLRTSVWGDEITQYMAFVSPIMTGNVKAEPIDLELSRIGYGPNRLRKVMDGVEMSPQEYDYYVRMAGNQLKAKSGAEITVSNPITGDVEQVDISGKGAKEALNALVNSQTYKTLTDGVDPPGLKVKYIRNVLEMYRGLAKVATLKKYDRLLEAVVEGKQDDMRAMGAYDDEVEDMGYELRQNYRDTFDQLQDFDLTGD